MGTIRIHHSWPVLFNRSFRRVRIVRCDWRMRLVFLVFLTTDIDVSSFIRGLFGDRRMWRIWNTMCGEIIGFKQQNTVTLWDFCWEFSMLFHISLICYCNCQSWRIRVFIKKRFVSAIAHTNLKFFSCLLSRIHKISRIILEKHFVKLRNYKCRSTHHSFSYCLDLQHCFHLVLLFYCCWYVKLFTESLLCDNLSL